MTAWINKNRVGFSLLAFFMLMCSVIGTTVTVVGHEERQAAAIAANSKSINLNEKAINEIAKIVKDHIEQCSERDETVIKMERDLDHIKQTVERIERKLP